MVCLQLGGWRSWRGSRGSCEVLFREDGQRVEEVKRARRREIVMLETLFDRCVRVEGREP